ncbi:MAG: AI-2E family transporter [Luteolibacter sp.]|uniref:AI-2E family transporter n=1 Tax=Luteolibacter sp. TaxID=1962973 RepID=UPI003264C13B
MRYPTPFQQKTLWNAATGVSILVLGALLVGLIWLVGYIFGFLQPVLVPLVVAGIVAYVVEPVVIFLEKRGMTRMWSVITLFLAILLGVTLLVAAVLPGVQRSHGALRKYLSSPPAATLTTRADGEGENSDNADHLAPALVRSLQDLRVRHRGGPVGWLLTEVDEQGAPVVAVADKPAEPETLESFARSRGGRMIVENVDVIFKTGKTWLTAGSTKVLGFFGLIIGMIMVPVYLFFFLKDSASIRTHWHDYVPLKASRFKTELVGTLQEINGYLVSFFRGQVLVAAIDGILVGIALTIFGLPYGFLIGVFMAILGVIPYIGNILCLIPACIIAYLHAQGAAPFGLSPWAYVGCVVGIFVVVQQINSLVTAPKIVGDSVGLHPLTVIFSMLFWSLVLGGFVGALLAVPLTAAVKVLFRRFIWERQLRENPELEPAQGA